MENNNTVYEKKSKKRFIIMLIVGLFVGFICGFLGAMGTDVFSEELANIGKTIAKNFPFVQIYILPWILLAVAVIFTVLNEITIQKVKKMVNEWDGEDDTHIRKADQTLSKVSLFTNIQTIGTMILFGLITYCMNLDDSDSIVAPVMTLVAVAIFLASLFITTAYQNRMVKLIKEYAPEKKGSIFDSKFQKVWYESCDEAERQIIGKASYKTVTFMNKVLSVFLTASIVIGMFFPIGILCAAVIGIIYLIITIYYIVTCMKLER